jgi:hypothetical protein
MTPLEKTEALYEELVAWYEDGDTKELRAASKLLMVALDKLHEHGGRDWETLVESYVDILANDPAQFRRLLDSQRGEMRTLNA